MFDLWLVVVCFGLFSAESMTPADSLELAGAWGGGWRLFAQDYGDCQHAQRAKDQGQPEVAHDLETQGGDRNAGKDMNV